MYDIQIETTTRCTLKCPACSRTQFSELFNRPYPHYDIDVDTLYNFFDCEGGRALRGFSLEGDYGDSIYYPHLFELIDRFRPTKNYRLVTNGAYRDSKYWNELCARLTNDDTVVFSIDGLEDTNHLYRINSDWTSTMLGLDIVSKSNAKLVWQTNIFNFNYNRLDEIKQFAESYGANFMAFKTERYGNDQLIPPYEYINTDSLYKKEYSVSTDIVIDPKCKNTVQHAISADNYFFACSWMSATFVRYKSKMWAERDKWSIVGQTYDDIREQMVKPWVNDILENMSNCDPFCKMKCKVNQVGKERHV
jgi:MoaA/NifB/PqqE/SkfB family radical SAM enzyme